MTHDDTWWWWLKQCCLLIISYLHSYGRENNTGKCFYRDPGSCMNSRAKFSYTRTHTRNTTTVGSFVSPTQLPMGNTRAHAHTYTSTLAFAREKKHESRTQLCLRRSHRVMTFFIPGKPIFHDFPSAAYRYAEGSLTFRSLLHLV